MDQEELKLLNSAQLGDETAKEILIKSYSTYVQNIAVGYCKRKLEWENDDELSIALLALNEAIDNYNPCSKKKFKNYLRMVVKSRLIDYFRKEGRHIHLSLDKRTDIDEEDEELRIEEKAAWEQYKEQTAIQERAEEMQQFEELLNFYGLSFQELEKASPKHQKTRDNLVEVARFIASRQDLLSYVKKQKRLPLKELINFTNNSKKIIKRGRKYILAVTLIISDERFAYLRSLFSLSRIDPKVDTGQKDLSQGEAGQSEAYERRGKIE